MQSIAEVMVDKRPPIKSVLMEVPVAVLGLFPFQPSTQPAAVPRRACSVSTALHAAEQERLMIEHLPTVRHVARQIAGRLPHFVEFEELLSAGTLGLIDASRKFNPDKNVQFGSYARFRIRGAILDSLRALDWSPRELRRKGRAVEKAIRAVTSRCGRTPGEAEVAREMGMALGDYHQLIGELKGLEISTLNQESWEDSSEEELATLPGKVTDDPLYQCLQGEARTRLNTAIKRLPERERLVMTLYYYEERSMKEIGLVLGVVESRVSEMHAAAVEHLRAMLADLASPGSKPARPMRARRVN